MSAARILHWIFFALWCASMIAWVVTICVPKLRKKNIYLWMLIPIWVFQIAMLIAKVC